MANRNERVFKEDQAPVFRVVPDNSAELGGKTSEAAADGRKALVGYFDGINGRLVDGWIYDVDDPTKTIIVQVFAGERLLGETTANLWRKDLEDAQIGDGYHGFRFLLPLELFDGASHEIRLLERDTRYILGNSPRVLNSRPLPPSEAFASRKDIVEAVPPLSDVQFTLLHAVHAVADNLAAQTRAITLLIEQLQSTLPRPVPQEAPLPVLAGPRSPEEIYGPLLTAARNHPTHRWDFIFFSIIDWGYRFQRPQQLAKCLAAQGHRVFYLSVKFEERMPEGGAFVIRAQPIEGVFEISLCCSLPLPNIYHGIDDALQLEELYQSLSTMASLLNIRSPVGIVEFPSWHPIAKLLPGIVIVQDCLDHVGGFSNVPPRVLKLEDELVDEAAAIVTSSQYLSDIVAKKRKSALIRNGVDIAYFAEQPAKLYEAKAKPVIGYYGAISDWFDVDLIAHCAGKHPEWHFVLIGAIDGCDVSAIRQLKNVELLGEKPYSELTSYLYAFDVCIIPFKIIELIKATNPVKVYEYLAAGKPIVATDMPELRLLPSNLVRIAESATDFEKGIGEVLKKKDQRLPSVRRAWASRQSWLVRARKLDKVVSDQFPLVSIIVLCYNNLAFTSACLSSILAVSDYPNLEILCVDNASTDGTQEFLTELENTHKAVRYIRNEKNLGFAAGNNVGMKAAQGQIQILLNNDTYVTKGWVRDLIRPLLHNSEIGLTGPLTNMIGNEQKLSIAYRNMEEMASSSARITKRRRYRTYDTDNLAFFCVAVRDDVVKKIGYLSEDYGVGFFEDDDYCHRALEAGYKLAICDDVFVHHHLSASFNQLATGDKADLMKRNRKIFEAKWGPWKPHEYRQEAGFGE